MEEAHGQKSTQTGCVRRRHFKVLFQFNYVIGSIAPFQACNKNPI